MHQHADELMKLPVPPLQQTLQKYITSVEVWRASEEREGRIYYLI